MFFLVIDILVSVHVRKQAFVRPVNAFAVGRNAQHRRAVNRQMLILTIGSVCFFFVTALPIGIYKIISLRDSNLINNYLSIISIWTGLGWLQSLFHAVSQWTKRFWKTCVDLFSGQLLCSLFMFKFISKRISVASEIYGWPERNSSAENWDGMSTMIDKYIFACHVLFKINHLFQYLDIWCPSQI